MADYQLTPIYDDGTGFVIDSKFREELKKLIKEAINELAEEELLKQE